MASWKIGTAFKSNMLSIDCFCTFFAPIPGFVCFWVRRDRILLHSKQQVFAPKVKMTYIIYYFFCVGCLIFWCFATRYARNHSLIMATMENPITHDFVHIYTFNAPWYIRSDDSGITKRLKITRWNWLRPFDAFLLSHDYNHKAQPNIRQILFFLFNFSHSLFVSRCLVLFLSAHKFDSPNFPTTRLRESNTTNICTFNEATIAVALCISFLLFLPPQKIVCFISFATFDAAPARKTYETIRNPNKMDSGNNKREWMAHIYRKLIRKRFGHGMKVILHYEFSYWENFSLLHSFCSIFFFERAYNGMRFSKKSLR